MITDKTREKWDEKIDSIFTCLVAGNISCTDWEIKFIDSISIKRQQEIDLSYRQSKTLNRIFEKIK